jgi:nitrate reductase gamma subunit
LSGTQGITGFQLLWWVILPYLALTTFVIGHVWRYRYDQFGWTSRSTELQEKKLLKWGSPIFHYATFGAIAGHVIGILIPESWTHAVGIPENYYHWFSAAAGTAAAVGIVVGIGFLAYRRLFVPRVRATTSAVDWLTLILLAIVIALGIAETVGVNLLGSAYDYRQSVALWFRGLFVANPDVRAIANAPLLYQVHATAAWAILIVWPFSRLVHAWSYPVWYLWRPFVVYRSRVAAHPNEPGTSGRRWRSIGTRY